MTKKESRNLTVQKGAIVLRSEASSLLDALTSAASDPKTDIGKMERLFAMHQQLAATQAQAAFNAAMSRAQAKIQPIVKTAENDHTKSMYAKLETINAEIVPIYTAEGLSVSFGTETANEKDPIPAGMRRTIAIVSHESGHDRRYHIDLALDASGSQGKVNKTDVQAAGSTSSYARRYLLLMIFNVSTGDDNDGNNEKMGLSDDTRKKFEETIEILDSEGMAQKLWGQIAAKCEKTGAVRDYAELKVKVATKIKELKKVAA